MNRSIALKFAGAAALAGSTQAYGSIENLPFLPSNIPGPDLGAGDNVEFYNFLTGSTDSSGADLKFEVYNGTSTYFFSGATPLKLTDAIVVNYAPHAFYASALVVGDKIGSDTSYFYQGPSGLNVLVQGQQNGSIPSYQQPNVPTYLGFQFEGADGGLHDGYFELETVPTPGITGGLFFVGGVYNTVADIGDGTGDITVEALPEPGTISSLVLGAAALAGVGFVRRRRAA